MAGWQAGWHATCKLPEATGRAPALQTPCAASHWRQPPARCWLGAAGGAGAWGLGTQTAPFCAPLPPPPLRHCGPQSGRAPAARPHVASQKRPPSPPLHAHTPPTPPLPPPSTLVTGEPLQVRATLSIPRGSAENTEQHLQCCACCWASEVWWAPCRRHLVPPAWRPAQAVTKAQQLQCCCGWCDPPLRVCAGPAGMRNRHLECILPGWKETPMPGRDCRE